MKYFSILFLFISTSLFGQLEIGLTAWITFDKPGCEIADQLSDPNIQTFPNGDLVCDCGVDGNSLRFDGNDDWFYLFGPDVEKAFTTIDFSLSFYFKSATNAPKSMALFSKRLDCNNDNAFAVRYNPATRSLSVTLDESQAISGSIGKLLDYSCWYHVVVVRKGGETILYINGKEVSRINSPGLKRVDLGNDEPLIVGSSDCNVDQGFEGFMDEIRLYSRALKREEVEALYLKPDQIATGNSFEGVKDTTIFLGNSVQANITHTCASNFLWSPAASVSDPTIPNPLLTPDETTTYLLDFDDAFCLTTDSFRVIVVDPSFLDCNDILLPTAFTPNGDGLNDGYGISNPFAVGELLAFDIYDRWGNIVFSTTDLLEKWDGSYKGKAVNPGVFLYKIYFRCNGKEGVKTGSVTVIR